MIRLIAGRKTARVVFRVLRILAWILAGVDDGPFEKKAKRRARDRDDDAKTEGDAKKEGEKVN